MSTLGSRGRSRLSRKLAYLILAVVFFVSLAVMFQGSAQLTEVLKVFVPYTVLLVILIFSICHELESGIKR